MALIPLKFRPGLVRDLTDYAGTGGWYDCNWVRFRDGLPEKMGGWTKALTASFLGTCRQMIAWTLLTGARYLALGTNLKFYVSDTGAFYDVTPIRRSVTLANNSFSVVSASTVMTVTDAANGSVVGDYVTYSGSTTFAGLSSGQINAEFAIASIIDGSHYTVTLPQAANATTVGGGAAIVADYQINTGANTSVIGLGWGAGVWGRGTWGSDATSGPTIQLRLWSIDTFGQDLIANPRNGNIYHWDATAPTTRMVALADLVGASDAPTVATAIAVSAEEAHTVAFGTNPVGSAVQDPLLVRWSDTESYLDWTPTATNTAGGYRLSAGTQIIAVEHTRGTTLIWTDIALYTMTWTGPPYIFSFQLVGANTSIIGPNAAVASNDVMFWMGQNQFYVYDGRIRVISCPITDYVFTRLNTLQAYKVYAFTNAMFNEVGWFYASSSENDSYVIYNYKEDAWYFGMLARTAWLDFGGSTQPLATGADSYLYSQEFGLDDGSTNPPTAISSFIESSPIEEPGDGPGMHYLFMDRLIPDVTFRNSSSATPSVTMTLATVDYPGSAVAQTNASTVQTTSALITQFTEQTFIRLRGRSATFRCESSGLGVTWRLGVPRVSYRIDGRR